MDVLRQHQDLLQQIALFGMAGITAVEILLRAFLQLVYTSLIKASGNPDQSRNKLMKKFREEQQVHNVDTFVEKCLLTHKVAGLQLWNTERLCRFFTCLFLIFGSTTVVLGFYLDFGDEYLLSTLSTLLLFGELLIIMSIVSKIPYQKDVIYINLMDYAETRWQRQEMESLADKWKERVAPADKEGHQNRLPEEDKDTGPGSRRRPAAEPVMNARERQIVRDVLFEYMEEQKTGKAAESFL